MERQLAMVTSATIWTYMCILDKCPLIAKSDKMSKDYFVDHKKHTDAKNWAAREKMGDLHLRQFDLWARHVRDYLKAEHAIKADQKIETALQSMAAWTVHSEQSTLAALGRKSESSSLPQHTNTFR